MAWIKVINEEKPRANYAKLTIRQAPRAEA